MEFEKEMLIVLFAIVLIWLLVGAQKEKFNNISTVSLPLGYPRYGLRGDPLRTESIDKLYLSRYPNVRLHPSNNEMYDSNTPPGDENVPGCARHDCPYTPGENYYKGSPCWMCSTPEPKQVIYDLWPHV